MEQVPSKEPLRTIPERLKVVGGETGSFDPSDLSGQNSSPLAEKGLQEQQQQPYGKRQNNSRATVKGAKNGPRGSRPNETGTVRHLRRAVSVERR